MANAFAHCELSTTDIAQAKKFDKSVFSWKLTDIKGMPYTMIDVGTGVGGGLGPNGAMGVFLDPAGAALGVWESAKNAAKPAAKKAKKKG